MRPLKLIKKLFKKQPYEPEKLLRYYYRGENEFLQRYENTVSNGYGNDHRLTRRSVALDQLHIAAIALMPVHSFGQICTNADAPSPAAPQSGNWTMQGICDRPTELRK